MRPLRAGWGERLTSLADWLLPSECVACDRAISESPPPLICDLCRVRWRPLPHPFCERCQHPRLLDLSCRLCADWPNELSRVRSAVLLDDDVRRIVHAFKYREWKRLAQPFAACIVPILSCDLPGTLVPIPTDRRRRWQRGYDQAVELADSLGAYTGRAVDQNRLIRVGRAGSQVGLTPEERLANLTGVFAATPDSGPVVLVDDVFTTGATLLSAALALRAAGVTAIAAVTFARAEPPLAGADRAVSTPFFRSKRFS